MLRVNIAFHSPYTEPIKKDFLELQTEPSVSAPKIPFFSSVTGRAIEGKIYPQYWWNNIRESVLFSDFLFFFWRTSKTFFFVFFVAFLSKASSYYLWRGQVFFV
eukprot:Phypoly_transcript_18071.p1 GENE.Phypoly_transcript_18071~~Phypoly_transcript_18071.p1  ORF type:complete len:104 (-),score=9.13 Phypoly_transcript_18071:253-564(-)